jgi:hypothetical protein
VVVDNGCRERVGHVTGPYPRARLIAGVQPGAYAARNRGIEAARGEILAFTDADCVPAPDWVERGVRALQGLAAPGLVGGRIDLMFHDPVRRTAAELFETLLGFRQQTYIEEWGFGATANLFTTRATLDRVGPFDERLMSGGDMEWGQRVRAQGLAQRYAADVRVSHPARRTLGALCRKALRVAGGLQQVADQRGLGTAGLLRHARRQLLQLSGVRAGLSDGRLRGVGRKLRFAAVAWLVEALQTIERYRVHFGGTPRRT